MVFSGWFFVCLVFFLGGSRCLCTFKVLFGIWLSNIFYFVSYCFSHIRFKIFFITVLLCVLFVFVDNRSMLWFWCGFLVVWVFLVVFSVCFCWGGGGVPVVYVCLKFGCILFELMLSTLVCTICLLWLDFMIGSTILIFTIDRWLLVGNRSLVKRRLILELFSIILIHLTLPPDLVYFSYSSGDQY